MISSYVVSHLPQMVQSPRARDTFIEDTEKLEWEIAVRVNSQDFQDDLRMCRGEAIAEWVNDEMASKTSPDAKHILGAVQPRSGNVVMVVESHQRLVRLVQNV